VWHDARLLNALAGALTGLALLALASAAATALVRAPALALREIEVVGGLGRTTGAELARAAATWSGGGFVDADLDALRTAVEALPWVRRAELRRLWPGRIELRIEEHHPFARWGEGELVSADGVRFRGTALEDLPELHGPAGSEAEVVRRTRRFAEIVAPLGVRPERVALSARRAWQLQLSSGAWIELGRDVPGDPVEARLARFVAAVPPALVRRSALVADLRYPAGFALRMPRTAQEFAS